MTMQQKISLTLVKSKTQGIIIYNGPSQIKVYILPEGIKPTKAVYGGKDESVCGDCPHRFVNGAGTCYVNPMHGPNGVFLGIQSGSYETVTPERASDILENRFVRLGAWGDPSAMPIEIWDIILSKVSVWTGYTHQWRKAFAQPLKKYCMASCESESHVLSARKKGWRTFRTRMDEFDLLLPGEFVCPASAEAGKRLTCQECKACSGGSSIKASPAIIGHGTNWKKIRLRKMLMLIKQKKKYRIWG